MNDPSDAEFEDDCCALDTALCEMLEEDEGPDGGDPHEHLATAELIREFYVKHRASGSGWRFSMGRAATLPTSRAQMT